MNKKGFTLIEVIIVIVILGVLATLALPRITGNLESSRAAEVMSMFGSIRRNAVDCLDMNNQILSGCDTWTKLNMTAPAETNFTYTVDTAAGVGGVITFNAQRNGSANHICMTINSTTGQAKYSFLGQNFQSIVTRTGNTDTRVCAAGTGM